MFSKLAIFSFIFGLLSLLWFYIVMPFLMPFIVFLLVQITGSSSSLLARGLFYLIYVIGFFGITLGIVSIFKIRKHELRGIWLSVIGIILSVLGIIQGYLINTARFCGGNC